MNLKALFETQAKLDADILVKHPVQEGEDRLSKKVLALQVELGECANEWRGFKFWSNDQEPRTEVYDLKFDPADGESDYEKRNPLLEEYVDVLHFVMSIANDLVLNPMLVNENRRIGRTLIDSQFREVFRLVIDMEINIWRERMDAARDECWSLIENILYLGKLLGFTNEQIEQAYYEKNKINHARQQSGY